MAKRRFFVPLTLTMLLMATAGPALRSAPAHASVGRASAVMHVSIRFQWVPQYQFAGYIIAKLKGYYQQAGLDVTLNPGGPQFPAMKLVAGGSDTFGVAGPDGVLLALQKGINVVTLATLFQNSAVAFMVRKDSKIYSPKDFVGKTVAVFYGSNVETEYRAMMAAAGVNSSQIREVPGQFGIEQFVSNSVDVFPVYATDEPDLVRRKGVPFRLLFARDFGAHLMGDTLFTTVDFVKNHPAATQAFVSASLRGWNYAVTHLAETVKLIAAYNKQLDANHLAFEGSETIKLLTARAGARCVGWNDTAAWQTEDAMLARLKILKAMIPVSRAFDNRFVVSYYRGIKVNCGM